MSHQDELIAKDIKAYLDRHQKKDLLRVIDHDQAGSMEKKKIEGYF